MRKNVARVARLDFGAEKCYILQMSQIRQFIEARREEIKEQIAALKQELRELNLAEGAIKSGVVPSRDEGVASSSSRTTIKEMVVEVLEDRPNGAEASEIIELIANSFGESIARSSLSPQLSRLKEEGVLSLEGRVWLLQKYAKGPEATTSEPNDSSGGGEVQERALPTASPEGAIPSTASPHHSDHIFDPDDDEIPF